MSGWDDQHGRFTWWQWALQGVIAVIIFAFVFEVFGGGLVSKSMRGEAIFEVTD